MGGGIAVLQVVGLVGLVGEVVLDRARDRRRPEIEEGVVGHVHAIDDGVVKVPDGALIDGAVHRFRQVPDRIVRLGHALGDELVVDLDQGEAVRSQTGMIGVEIGIKYGRIGLEKAIGHQGA